MLSGAPPNPQRHAAKPPVQKLNQAKKLNKIKQKVEQTQAKS